MTPHAFAHELERVYGDQLLSVVLYGSAVGGDFSKRFSDYNLFCVLREVTPATLTPANRLVRRWMKRGNPSPHFFEPDHIERSLDVFPIEFLDMLDRHEVLLGRDPLIGIAPEATHLRHQCESELKGKLIHLRAFYAANCHKPRRVARMMVSTFPTFLAAMRAVLRLTGEKPPADSRAVVELLAGKLELNPTVFFDLIDIRRGEGWLPRRSNALSAFERYLTELTAITRFVDQLQCT